MTWQYDSTTGTLSHNAVKVGTGYSGHGAGLDNVHLESMHNVGPIPRGAWTIGDFKDNPDVGKFAATLTPAPETNTFGRSGFYCHGDTEADLINGTRLASHGCIILARPLREQIRDSGDRDLLVV